MWLIFIETHPNVDFFFSLIVTGRLLFGWYLHLLAAIGADLIGANRKLQVTKQYCVLLKVHIQLLRYKTYNSIFSSRIVPSIQDRRFNWCHEQLYWFFGNFLLIYK